MFFPFNSFKILVSEVDQQYTLMPKSVLRTLTETSEAKISCDCVEKSVDLAEVLDIDIYYFKDSSSVEDGMVDAYNTSGMQFTVIFSNIFCGISIQCPLHCVLLTI